MHRMQQGRRWFVTHLSHWSSGPLLSPLLLLLLTASVRADYLLPDRFRINPLDRHERTERIDRERSKTQAGRARAFC
jgi:hypothetical protein